MSEDSSSSEPNSGSYETGFTSYAWTIRNFTTRTEKRVKSPLFSSANCKWMLILEPNCPSSPLLTYHIYLKLIFSISTIPEINVLANFSFLTKENERAIHDIGEDFQCYNSKCNIWGRDINVRSVLMDEDVLLPQGHLTILCELTYFTPQALIKHLLAHSRSTEDLFYNKTFYDATLLVDGQELKVHKNMLANKSEVFAAMFKDNGMVESTENRVEIVDIEFKVLREMIKFIYTGYSALLPLMAKDLIVAANKYALKDLENMCEDVVCQQLTVANACEVFVLAELLSNERFQERVLGFIATNIKEVLKSDGWSSLALQQVNKIVSALAYKTEK